MQAPYAATVPFPATLAALIGHLSYRPRSSTLHRELAAAAWSSSTMPAAPRSCGRRSVSGARVVFISARRASGARRFACAGCALIDEHWIAYPELIAGGLSVLERLKLRLLRRPTVRYLDVILLAPTPRSGVRSLMSAPA